MLEIRQKFKRTSLALAGLVLFLPLASAGAEAVPATNPAAVAGQPSGPYIEHFPNGKQKVTGQYVAGRKSGKWTTFDESGKVLETAVYKDGVRNGAWILNYPNGRPRVRGTFLDGRATGTITVLDERGQALRQIAYPKTYGAVAKVFAELYPDD